jgi:crotonobetainyl-CoA hydratase
MTAIRTSSSGAASSVTAFGTDPVLVHRIGHVMIVTLNRPEVRNAVNLKVSLDVGHALDEADNDPAVRAVIVTSAGDQSFCAGADLKALSRGEPIRPYEGREAAWGFAGLVRHPISKPVIAAVNGLALGGGTEIVLACDLAVAADTATFGLPEVKRGIYAGAGGILRLPAQIPHKAAMYHILTGEPMSAQQALEFGLVNKVVPKSDVLKTALDIADRIGANAPLSVQASKRIALGIRDSVIESERTAWALNDDEGKKIMASEDAREGPTAFAEKRAPIWQAK